VAIVHATRIVDPTMATVQSHTFVIDGNWFFDLNTLDGRPIPLPDVRRQILDVHPILAEMRVVDYT
jgi:hypothetical protein